MRPEQCGDTIEMDKMLLEMSIEELLMYKSLHSQCDCDACQAALAIVMRELAERGIKIDPTSL